MNKRIKIKDLIKFLLNYFSDIYYGEVAEEYFEFYIEENNISSSLFMRLDRFCERNNIYIGGRSNMKTDLGYALYFKKDTRVIFHNFCSKYVEINKVYPDE